MANKNDFRILKGSIEIAKYKLQILEEYRNNPFIEALPPIFNEDDVIDKFYNIPGFENTIPLNTKNVRFHVLKRIKTFTQTLPIHLSLEYKVSTMIRQGYLARNPIESDYFSRLQIQNDTEFSNDYSEELINYKLKYARSTADCFTILGISGIGKTTAIERLLLMYPQVIKHNTYNNNHFTRTQIVWLKIDCPHDGSLAVLCRSFFSTIDNLLGTRYMEKHGYSSKVISTMMIAMTKLANLYGIGILVIDEIQHLLCGKNDMEEMLNFLVTLSNTVGIPTMLVGTPKAQAIFKGNFRQARRASSNGCIIWDRMKNDSDEWNIFVETLWEMQVLKTKVELTRTLNDAFYEETQGITSVAIDLFILAQERALIENKEELTIELLKKTVRTDLKLLLPMLNAIKKNNAFEIAKYDDLTIDFKSISEKNYNSLQYTQNLDIICSNEKNKKENIKKNKTENLFLEIKCLNIFDKLTDADIHEIINREVDQTNEDIDLNELKSLCIRKAFSKNDELSLVKTKKVVKFKDNSLLKLFEISKNKKVHPYNSLKESGYIKDTSDELIW